MEKHEATMPGLDKKEAGHETLEPTTSIDDAQYIELQENRNGQFHRSFTPRQVHVSIARSLHW